MQKKGEGGNARTYDRPRGAAEKNLAKVMCICRSAKKKIITRTCSILFLFLFFIGFVQGAFWSFRNKGSFFSKIHLGSSQKNAAFFSSVFFFFFAFDCFLRFFLSRFSAFRNKGS
jgi:hypothetical protein